MKKKNEKLQKAISSDKSISVDLSNKMPNYITKKPKFSCPLSPYIMWHHGIVYKECPLPEKNRDMGSCADCKLRGKAQAKGRKSKKVKQKTTPKIERKKKEPIPVIGKTYSSK